jgi:23S rRNA (guanine2445-N2)-methyltransferase / 23S rRNA (guanine2069-N7)-methyltransferase
MCGSGTLPIEAALIALDRAPGLLRTRFGFLGWRGHDAAAWSRLVDEARARAAEGERRKLDVRGYDVDGRAIHSALGNAERAGLHGRVHLERRPLQVLAPVEDQRPGIVIANPPYGERLGEAAELAPLYQEFGDLLRRRFPGWTGFVFTGNPDLAKKIGLRAARRHILWNGALECRLLEFPISVEAPVDEPRWRKPRPPDPAIEMFKNRVAKNLRHLSKWTRREDVHAFRAYDADLPEYAVAVDVYQDALHVQEYAPPSTIEPERAERRLADIMTVLPEVAGVAPENVFLKVRRRQRPVEQYQKLGASGAGAEREVREGGHRFLVNLRDYIDTGLFLDHRRLRALIAELATGRRFLNLFSYTATASVYAARAGARSTVSVDLSNTYLEWARRNFELNGVRGHEHELVRSDCMEWLAAAQGKFGLIFAAPPTFSNSKMAETFEVQRDHAALLRAAGELLEPDGVLLFSNHFRRFKMDSAALPGFTVENITSKTIPPDFARNPRVHNSWRLRRSL